MAIGFSNIPAGDGIRVPLFYAEMDNSMANSATSEMRRLIIAQVNDNATADEIGKLTLLSSEEDAARIGGNGSMLESMMRIWRKNDPLGEVWCVPCKLTDGTAASGKIAITGTATEAGLLSVYIGAELIQTTVTVGMTATEVGDALVSSITEEVTLPVTASNTTGTVTLTSKFKGVAGNDIKIELNRLGTSENQVTPSGLTAEVTAMSGGAGSPDMDDVGAAMGDEDFEFICMPWSDTTTLDAWKEIMCDESGRWSYVKQLFGHVYSVRRGTFANLCTEGQKRNDQHVTTFGMEDDIPNPMWEFVAAATARIAVFISADPARPTHTGTMVGISPAKATNRFDIQERNTLLKYGIATTNYTGGNQQIDRAITTYQKNKSGAPDNSYLDSETMHTSAYVIDTLKIAITSKFARHKLGDDGNKYGSGQPVATPKSIRGELIAVYNKLVKKAICENVDKFAEALIVERDVDSPNRVNVLLPPDYVNQLRVFAVLNQFRLQYN
nr:MAG TPA: tail component [Caudoviricetes sp.]